MMSSTKHAKSVSCDGNDEYVSAASSSTTSEDSQSEESSDIDGSHAESTVAHEYETTLRAASPDSLGGYGLWEGSDASDDSFVLGEDGQLFRVREGQWDAFGSSSLSSDADDNASDDSYVIGEDGQLFRVREGQWDAFGSCTLSSNADDNSCDGSEERQLEHAISDDKVEHPHDHDKIPSVALFGNRFYDKITSSNLLEEILGTADVHFRDFDLIALDEQPRDVYPEHAKLVLNIVSDCANLAPLEFQRKLRHDLHHNPEVRSGSLPKTGNSPLKIYGSSNRQFKKLENAWLSWHKRIQHLQQNLISIVNTRACLVEAGQKLAEVKAIQEHALGEPESNLGNSPHESANSLVGAIYNAEMGKHETPKSLSSFSAAYEIVVTTENDDIHSKWEQLEKNFSKVMIPLRYAQAQFRNLQLKFEHALANEILKLRKAIIAHERLEIEWTEAVLGETDETKEDGDLALSDCDEFEQPIEAPDFDPPSGRMQRWMKVSTSDMETNFQEFFNSGIRPPRFDPDFCFNGESRSRSFSVERSPSSRSSSASHRDPSPRVSIDTPMTSIDEGPEGLKLDTTASPESRGLGDQTQRVKSPETIMRTKSAHEKMTEIMQKHEATRDKSSQTSENRGQNSEETASGQECLDELVARHATERDAREEYTNSNSKRLHEFGLIDFENIRRIHRDIMGSLASNTDKRGRLGLLISHLQECQLCWCDAGSTPCCRCERLQLGYHFGVGKEGYWVGTLDGKRVIDEK